jgi:MerR family transcriptional regulator, copper efflux regulator
MNIGQVAEATGLTTKAIRHYEMLGLVVPERCSGNSYRNYSLQDLEELRFLQRSRSVGFSLDESGQLLDLYRHPERNTLAAKSLLMDKLAQLDQQWLTLNHLRQTLASLAAGYIGEREEDVISEKPDKEKPANSMPFTLIGVSGDE